MTVNIRPKHECPTITLTKDNKVLYNDIDISEHCVCADVHVALDGTDVMLSFSDVVFKDERHT